VLEQADLHPRLGRPGPVAITGYHEPSFVFLTGRETELTDPAGAARALAEGRPAIVEERDEAAFRDAEAREREAEAEAKATQMVSDAIAQSGSQALNYFIAQKYTDAVSQFATSPNAKTILFPVEATQLIGTLGGIGELAREAFGDKRP
jgi:hypothetical protein